MLITQLEVVWGLLYGLSSLLDCLWLSLPYYGVKTENSFQGKNLIDDMCEGNQEGLKDRIWVDRFTHMFLHISICVCEKVHVCTDTYVGGECVNSCVQVQMEARLWFLGC